jgi:hypothetical protein
MQKVMNPTKLISSEWIRPEDIHFYDELGEGKIIVKLTDRSATTDWLIRVIEAYSEEKKAGNLVDILLFTGNRQVAQIDRITGILGVLRGNVKGRFMKRIIQSNTLMPVYVDNSQLDGFLEGMQGIDCRNTLCHDQGWIEDNASGKGCNYCRNFALKAVKIDKGMRQQVIEYHTNLLRDVYDGKLF